MKYFLLVTLNLVTAVLFSQHPFRDQLKKEELSKNELINRFQKEKNGIPKAIIANEIGLLYQREVKLDSAMYYHRSALDISSQFGKNEERGVSANKVGIVHYMSGQIDSAIYYFKMSIPYYEQQALKANSLSNLALMHKLAGNPNLAIKDYLQALSLVSELKEFKKQATILNNISSLHFQLENYEKAKDYARQGLATSKKYKVDAEIISAKNNLASVLLDQDSVDLAIKYFQEGVDLSEKTEDLSFLVDLKNNLANAFGKNNEPKRQQEIYFEVLDLFENTTQQGKKSAVLLNISSTFEDLNQIDSALYYANQARRSALKFQRTEFLEQIYSGLSELYKKNDQLDSSIFYKDAIILLRDSLNKESEELLMHELEEQYKNGELKGELDESKEEISKTTSYLFTTIVILLIVGVVALLLIYFVRNYRKRSKELEHEVGEKSESLTHLKSVVSEKDQEIETLQFVKEKKKLPYPSNLTPLTTREKEVLEGVSDGLKDQEIADKLFLSITTVRTHLRKVYVKIDARNRAEAVQFYNEYEINE